MFAFTAIMAIALTLMDVAAPLVDNLSVVQRLTSWGAAVVAIGLISSGFALTSLMAGLSPLRSQPVWVYPTTLAALFLVQTIWLTAGYARFSGPMPLQVIGAAVAFAVGLAGNLLLRKVNSPTDGSSTPTNAAR
jgi:hypothetical protein